MHVMNVARMQAVEDMCLHRMADRLYGSLQRECDAHIGRQLASLASAQTADPTIFLQQVGSGVRVIEFVGVQRACWPPAGQPGGRADGNSPSARIRPFYCIR